MTSIILSDGTTNLEIFTAKVDEQCDKTIVNWSDYVPPAKWSTTSPKKNTMDSKNITRAFTISGYINEYSAASAGSSSSLVARDRLNSYFTKGGTIKFNYGITGDITGLSPAYTAADGYYTANGFTVHITRLQITEDPKGGDSGEQATTGSAAEKQVPEEYRIQLQLLVCTEYTS